MAGDPKQKVDELANRLVRYRKAYYDGHPEVSDAHYDALEEELRALAPGHPVLRQVGVAADEVAVSRMAHDTPMLSLDKTYSIEDLESWIDGRSVVGLYKIDGNSLSVVYRNGKLAVAKTRGNGRFGEVVTDKVRRIKDIFPELHAKHNLEIRGELYCNESQFIKLSKEMERRSLDRPTNPRNIVAGLLGRKEHVDLAAFFNFFAFDVLSSELRFESEFAKLQWLGEMGFSLPNPQLLTSPPEVRNYLDRVKEKMSEDEIAIDGAVFIYDDVPFQNSLGATSHHPRYKISFKWPGQTAVTEVLRVDWTTSRLGIVTPVAVVNPVFLSGAQLTNITMHNAGFLRLNNLVAGDKIEIIRSGEVIPKFLGIVEKKLGQCILPSQCPSCSAPLQFDDVRLFCPNILTCPAQRLGSIINWIRCAEIDDLSDRRVGHLLELGLVRTIADLYRLKVEDILTLPLTKDKMAQKLYKNIQESKTLPLAHFLNGLGISGMGHASWEAILEHFPSLPEVQAATLESISNVEGFAEKTAGQIVEGLQQRRVLIEDLLAVGVAPQILRIVPSAVQALAGKQFVITGALSVPRSEIEQLVKAAGGKVVGSVSKNTSAVITEDADSSSSKAVKARSLGIPFWNEAQLRAQIDAGG